MYLQRLEVVLWSCGADPDEISLLDVGQVGGELNIGSIGFPSYDLTFSVLSLSD